MSEEGGSTREPRSWHALVLLAMGVIALAAIAFASAHPSEWVWSLPSWPMELPPLPQAPRPSLPAINTNSPNQGTDWVAIIIGVLLAAVGLAVIGFLLYLLGKLLYRVLKTLITARIAPQPKPDTLDTGVALRAHLTPAELAATTQDALHRLGAAATPHDGVIAAWLTFEEAAARHGVQRDLAQTPTEFTGEVLHDLNVPDEDAVTLRRLYSRARFSNLPTTVADVALAQTALRHISQSLDHGPIAAGVGQ